MGKSRITWKRATACALTICLLLSLAACSGGKNQKAFEASKAAYQNVNAAYEIVEDMGNDIYGAWRMGIYDDDELMDEGCAHLASELSLSEDELIEGVVGTLSAALGDDAMDEETKQKVRDNSEIFFTAFEDNLFTFCVEVVKQAYIANGKADEAGKYLQDAKAQMKDMSENYSDYEHYPALKGYYTTTSSFYDFCTNPQGSFDQIKTTIEDYRGEARDYNADLDYIFEE